MGRDHNNAHMDRARDELMSHVVRCDVLDARMEDRNAWLDETMEYMIDRYPGLSNVELAALEMMGRQFIKPVIPHGAANHASNRPEPTVRTDEGETLPQSEVESELVAVA